MVFDSKPEAILNNFVNGYLRKLWFLIETMGGKFGIANQWFLMVKIRPSSPVHTHTKDKLIYSKTYI